MNKVKYWMYGASAMLLAPLVRAEGNSSNIDLTSANNAADEIGTALKTLITGKILTNVLIVMGAALSIWAAFLVYKHLKRGAGK